jgi:hypothetical protein
MAASLVQDKANVGGAATLNIVFDSSVSAGNLLVCVIHHWDTHTGAPVVTDSQANTWAVADESTIEVGHRLSIAYAMNSSAGSTTVTVTPDGGAADVSAVIMEFSGIKTSAALDDTGNARATATTLDVTLNPTGTCLYVTGIGHSRDNPTTSANSPATKVTSEITSWAISPIFAVYYVGTGSQNIGGSHLGVSDIMVAAGATFQEADAGGATIPIFQNYYRQRRA